MGLIEKEFFTQPLADEIEVTIFGTGGGYGEAVALKLKDHDWIIIDSCQNPVTKEPLIISYLNRIGVDIKNDVKLVICTHWHNDHIMGLAETLRHCENAKFCMPSVHDTKKFLQLVGLDYCKIEKGSISSFNEFKDCVEINNTRKKQLKRLNSDCVIYNEIVQLSNLKNENIQLYSLSPSDSVVLNFDKEISTLITDFQLSKTSVTHKSANEKSSVIYLKYKDFSVLLGADLEVGKSIDEGWNDICNNSVLIKNKSIIYKVPHHGSENAYDEMIYNSLVDPDAILKITPWNRNTKLPKNEMVDIYKKHSPNVYITSPINISDKPKKREKSVEKIIKQFSRKLAEVRFEEGIIRTRHNLTLDKDALKVETYGKAFKM